MNPNGQSEAEGIGHPNFWGFSPSVDLLDRMYVDGGDSQPLFTHPSVDLTTLNAAATAIFAPHLAAVANNTSTGTVDLSAAKSSATALLSHCSSSAASASSLTNAGPSTATSFTPTAALNMLQLHAGDARHTIHTLSQLPRWRRAIAPASASITSAPSDAREPDREHVALYTAEPSLEGLARHCLLLTVATDEALSAPVRARLLLALHSNALLTWPQYHYLAARAVPRVLLLVEEETGPLAPLVDVAWLKGREKDDLATVIRDWVGAAAGTISTAVNSSNSSGSGSGGSSGSGTTNISSSLSGSNGDESVTADPDLTTGPAAAAHVPGGHQEGRAGVVRMVSAGMREERARWAKWQRRVVALEAATLANAKGGRAGSIKDDGHGSSAAAVGSVNTKNKTTPAATSESTGKSVADATTTVSDKTASQAVAAADDDDDGDSASVMARFGLFITEDSSAGDVKRKKSKKTTVAKPKAMTGASASASSSASASATAAPSASSESKVADDAADFVVSPFPLYYPPPPPFTPNPAALPPSSSLAPSASVLSLAKLRDTRVRAYLGQRFDSRLNLFDFDLTFRLQGTCSVVHGWNYKRWRETGQAYEDEPTNKTPATARNGEQNPLSQSNLCNTLTPASAGSASAGPSHDSGNSIALNSAAAAVPAGSGAFVWSNSTLISRREATDVSTAASRSRYSTQNNGGSGPQQQQ